MTVIDLETRHHALYRFYDHADALLYIGISASLPARIDAHDAEKPWWADVARVSVDHYTSRSAVLDAEREAIIAERPVHNIHHANGRKRHPIAKGAKRGRLGIEVGKPYAFGMANGMCHVGIVDVLTDEGFAIDRLSWISGFFDGPSLWLRYDRVEEMLIALQMGHHAKQKAGYDPSRTIWDMEPLGDFQTRYEQRLEEAQAA